MKKSTYLAKILASNNKKYQVELHCDKRTCKDIYRVYTISNMEHIATAYTKEAIEPYLN